MTFPSDLTEREAYILDQVQNGAFQAKWAWLKSTNSGHTAYFRVMADALRVEYVRINVSARLEQQIADVLGCMLLTPKIADLMWLQRSVTLVPYPRQITSSTQAMIEHSAKIDAALVAVGDSEATQTCEEPSGIIVTVGKHWVIDKDLLAHPGRAENYGWHFAGSSFQGISGEPCASLIKDPKTGSYYKLIQGRGWAHDISHADYSQTCVLMRKWCWVDGQLMQLADLLQDATLAPLATHNGTTTVLRQPGVSELAQAHLFEVEDPPLEPLPSV